MKNLWVFAVLALLSVSLVTATPTRTTGALECTICELVVNEAELLLTNSTAVEAEVIKALDAACASLPSSLSSMCSAFVNQYGSELINLLVQDESPEKVCQQLGVCSATATVEKKQQVQGATLKALAPEGALECSMCTSLMNAVEQKLSSAPTEAEVESVLEHLCTDLPGSFATSCATMVVEYYPMLVQLLLTQETPDRICAQIGLCSSQAAPVATKVAAVQSSTECTLCEYFIGIAESELSAEPTEQEVEAVLEKVCTVLPSYLQSPCASVIVTYYPQIVNLLVAKQPPSVVCAEIGLCSNSSMAISQVVTKVEPVTGALECELCQIMMSTIEGMLSSNRTEAEIEQVLNEVCSILPSSISSLCTSIIDQYAAELIQMFLNKETPSVICQQIGLCSATTKIVVEKVEKTVAAPEGALECTVCEAIMSEVENLLQGNYSLSKIESVLDEVCDIVPSTIRSICVDLINQYTPQLIELLLNKETPAVICQQLGLCSAATTVQAVAPEGALECTVCEAIMSEVENLLQGNYSLSKIESVLDEVCDIVPSTIRSICVDLINQYTPQLIELLLNKETPAVICQQLGLCSTSAITVTKVEAAPEGALECELCQIMMSTIEGMLSSNRTEQEIQSVLDEVCNILPSSISPLCTSVINQYSAELIQMFLNKETPAVICQQIGLCSAQLTAPEGALECTVCEAIMSEVENLLQGNYSLSKIESVLDEVCDVVPSTIRSICVDLINQYTPQLIELLLNKETPAVICQQLGLCSASLMTTASPALAAAGGALECTLCEYVMSAIENELSANSTEAEIEAVLEKACSIVPSSVQVFCDNLITEFTPQIINLLLAKESPSAICQALGLCSSTAAPVKAMLAPASTLECEFCQYLMGVIETELSAAPTETEVEALLQKVCTILPSSIQGACSSLIVEYYPQLVQLLVSKESPATICSQIGLCANASALYVHETRVALTTAVAAKNTEGTLECEFCQYLMNVIEEELSAAPTEQEVEDLLQKVCTILPSSVQGVCSSLVVEYYPQLVQLLVTKESPATICSQLGLCSSAVAAPVKLVQEPTLVAPSSSLECDLCQDLIAFFESKLSDDPTTAEIETMLDNVCQELGPLASTCEVLVAQDYPVLLQTLLNKETPVVACQQLFMCPKNTTETLIAELSAPEANIVECELCTLVIQVVEEKLESNATEAEVLKYLDEACSLLPTTYQSLCVSLVNSEFDSILQNIINKESPSVLCGQIGLCAAAQVEEPVVKAVTIEEPTRDMLADVQKVGASISCPECEIVMSAIEATMSSATTEAEVEAKLDTICAYLGSFEAQCETLIASYYPQLVQYIIAKEPPQTFCTQIGVCTAESPVQSAAMLMH